MINYIIEFINVVCEILIMLFYFNGILIKKYTNIILKIITIICCIVFFTLTSIMKYPSYINNLIVFIISLTITTVFYKDVIIKKIYIIIFYIVILKSTSMLTTSILNIIFSLSYYNIPNIILTRIIGMTTINLFSLLISAIISRVYSKKIKNLPIKYWLYIIFCPIFSFIILLVLDRLLIEYNLTNLWFTILPIMGLIYINFITLNLFEDYYNRLEIETMKELEKKASENYKILENNEQEVRKLKHDMNNNILVLKNLIDKNNIDTAKEYLNELSIKIGKVSSTVYTKNYTLDSVLNIEAKKAQLYDISYKVSIISSHEIFISSIDISTILCNALDNAIEGAKDSKKKLIYISIEIKKDRIYIIIQNSISETDNINLISNKQDKKQHGYGLKNIKEIVNKYEGYIDFKIDEDIFILDIKLENKILEYI